MGIENNQVQDLKISGSGTAGGGTYKYVSMSGSGKINGDLQCKELKISGSGAINGRVHAEIVKTSGSSTLRDDVEAFTVQTSGSARFKGNVIAKEMITSGSGSVDLNLNCKYLKSSGSFNVRGKITGGKVNASGSLKVDGDCEVETFDSSGSIKINGLLNADEINIKVNYHSSVREIGGEKVTVKEHNYFSFIKKIIEFFSFRKNYLEVDVIEGDEINLEVTKAQLVRGKDIVIGSKCEIEKVEYSGSIRISSDAEVRQKIKI
jgi:cytoskeletal protein CcmA (bactofilin family)